MEIKKQLHSIIFFQGDNKYLNSLQNFSTESQYELLHWTPPKNTVLITTALTASVNVWRILKTTSEAQDMKWPLLFSYKKKIKNIIRNKYGLHTAH